MMVSITTSQEFRNMMLSTASQFHRKSLLEVGRYMGQSSIGLPAVQWPRLETIPPLLSDDCHTGMSQWQQRNLL